ncbi:MAG: FAD-binding protein, partial [Rhodobacteraceae bacterium]|nr:FAD-binding protein [Paracoccaceae bacterium]
KPTGNDAAARWDWSADNAAEVAAGVFVKAADVVALAGATGAEAAGLAGTLAQWAAVCASGDDPLGRPASSLHPLVPPYFVARLEPVVSNTQGGPVHDARQRVCDAFGGPIAGLFAAGECGSVFGHLYMSGGNLAECFVGGRIAGAEAAAHAAAAEVSIWAKMKGEGRG